MVFQLQRVVFNMRRFLPIVVIITTSLLSVEQTEAACAADSDGVITVTDNNCSVQPDSYGITMYKMYFCTSAPTAATTSAEADISSCVLVFDAGTTGSRVDMTGTGDAGYGQSNVVTAVSAGSTITATQWTTLLARLNSIRQHQGTSINISSFSACATQPAITIIGFFLSLYNFLTLPISS